MVCASAASNAGGEATRTVASIASSSIPPKSCAGTDLEAWFATRSVSRAGGALPDGTMVPTPERSEIP